MGRSAKPRKAYRPRDQLADPVSWAIAGVHTFPIATQQAIMAPIHAAVLRLKQGRAGRDDWNIVRQALNVAEALAALHIGPNLLPQIGAGQQALHAIARRMVGAGHTVCDGAELVAIDEAVAMYRAQLRLCTQAESSRAFARVKALHALGAMDDDGRLFEQMRQAA